MTAPVARRIVLAAEPLVDGPTSLRPWRDADVEALTRICRDDPELGRWVSVPQPYGPEHARGYLYSRFDGIHCGRRAPFAIVDTAEGELLGSITLMDFAWAHRRAEVGYWLGAAARGHGHAGRALRLICGWGVEVLGLARIELGAAVENAASQRVAERAGFTRELIKRSSWSSLAGDRHDMVCFGLLAHELPR